MTLLMFNNAPDGIYVVTDTLATSPTEPGLPTAYASKVCTVPHINLVIAGTGLHPFAVRWALRVQTNILALDIDMLNNFAPEALRQLLAELFEEFGATSGTTTVYHFGRSMDGELKGYAYRSTDNFESELLPSPVFAVKPHRDVPYEPPDDLEGIITLAHRVRDDQAELPAAERIYIGGELCFTSIAPEGLISNVKIHSFPEFVDDWNKMNEPYGRYPSAKAD